MVKRDRQSAILDYFKNFTDLKVRVNEMFLSEDGTRLAIQWDWTATRKRDRKRATANDAILVHLVGGKSPPGTNTSGNWSELSSNRDVPHTSGSSSMGVDMCSFRCQSPCHLAIVAKRMDSRNLNPPCRAPRKCVPRQRFYGWQKMPSAGITRILKKWSSESEKLASSAVFARGFLLAIAYGFVPNHVSAANCTAIVFPIVSIHSRHVSGR